MSTIRLLAAALAAAPLFALSGPARAAASYDACTGFIASVPTTISTQGVWCFNKDLATSIATGAAITITNSNVTIDCNSFKLGGLSAGTATETVGILADARTNITVRDCNIRGFLAGAVLGGDDGFSGGHKVENNRFEYNTTFGLLVYGPGSMVRDNTVVDTGGTTQETAPLFIAALGVDGRVDVVDNQISIVDGTASGSGAAVGVLVSNPDGNAIDGNRIGGFYVDGGQAVGVGVLQEGQLDIRNNTFAGGEAGSSVQCAEGGQILYANALMMGEPGVNCYDGGDNYGLAVAP